ncbi:hypothetical protein niasHS_007183 [Heterodera schachtii]|uniref:SUEL-type lectin domain-containing protein n=1 Tax=Heterodera schachtii TaxID=97005 RepID=A0ABD2JJP5_HETSC
MSAILSAPLFPIGTPLFRFLLLRRLLVVSVLLLPCLGPILAAAAHQELANPELLEALLAESLRLNHVKACEGERVLLHCPRNTHISVQNTFYGRLVPSQELCPAGRVRAEGQRQKMANGGGAEAAQRQTVEDTSCDLGEAHSRVLELCRGKRKCRLLVRPEFFGDRDPCPGTSKYLQIGYKCSPENFEDQNFCEGQHAQLGCKTGRRLSIYSANYGRTTNGQAMHCSRTAKRRNSEEEEESEEEKQSIVREDCVSDVLPQLARRCHAQPSCTFPVDDRFLGNPCPRALSKYLSVIFVCINDEVFSEAALFGRLEKMVELEKELDRLRHLHQNRSSPSFHKSHAVSSLPGTASAPSSQQFFHHPLMSRHPLISDQWDSAEEGEESTDYGIEEAGTGQKLGDERREDNAKMGRRDGTEGQRRQTEEEEEKHRREGQDGTEQRGHTSVWQTLLSHFNADEKNHAPFVILLLLSLFIIFTLSLCLLILCQHRRRERRSKCRNERQNCRRAFDQEFQRQNSLLAAHGKERRPMGSAKCELGLLLAAGESSNASPVYVDSSDGSNHRLLDTSATAFPPHFPPPMASTDIYHECYLPCGSLSSFGGYYSRFDEQQQRMGTALSGHSSARKGTTNLRFLS